MTHLADNITIEDWLGADNTLGIDIWNKKYRNNDESFADWINRISAGKDDVAQMILDKKFLFGGRILATRGIEDGTKYTFSNCYVLTPPEDSIESIYDTCKKLARTYSYGGGVGIDISKLAPEGATVHNQAKTTSGAVSFMDTFSQVTQQIGQKGRRGALMISIDCTHPDLEKFIHIKNDLNKVNYANISVRVSNEFMEAVQNDEDWKLTFQRPETGELIEKTVRAKDIYHQLCESNWDYAEPGILYWDTIKNYNLQSDYPEFAYAGTNPCAEEPLPAGGSCLLGSLNLSAFVVDDGCGTHFDEDEFRRCVKLSVQNLNDVRIEGAQKHPLSEQRICAEEWRQIGLGVMGIADMLIKLGMVYGSEESIRFCDRIGRIMARTALEASAEYAALYGAYPKWDYRVMISSFYRVHSDSKLDDLVETYGLANSQLMTIAPTGTLSTMLGISGGIEPIFANSYTRTTKTLHDGQDVTYKVYTPIVREYMESHGITEEADLPAFFVTSGDIPIKQRIAMQSIWQKHIDASISSTVNLPHETTVEEVEELYLEAFRAGLKGITVFRDGCARVGILNTENHDQTEESEKDVTPVYKKNVGLERHLTTGCGSLHVCAYFDENGDLKNTYLSKGSTGGCNNFMIGLSRMVSLAARNGVKIDQIIDQLQSCGSCPSYAVRRATKHDTSPGSCCPVAIGNALIDMWKEVNGVEFEPITQKPPMKMEVYYHGEKAKCPMCGGELIFEMGCVTCRNCGYSKCG